MLRTVISASAALAALSSAPAIAQQGKTPKSAVHYQNTPKNGKQCSGCRFFKAGSSASADGTCSIVQGAISPKGWCSAWAAKS